MPATETQIARINELSGLARTAWFTLLGYLVFVGITLLGVKDADFFVPSRQTDLPLVGVQIPTASFFWTAPILGAALYTYLHLFLIKLWDAHAEARTTDADPTHHWLVNDFVLIRQRDPVALARPLAFLTDWITRLLVWAAGPIVLAYAWWRSMPAHNEWLTLLIATCLWLILVVGFTSWWRAEASLGRLRRGHWSTGAAVPTAGLAALLLVAVSWLRTEGGLDNYARGFWTLDDVTFRIPADTPVVRWFTTQDLLLPLARTDLAGVELVALPDDWRTPETARSAFRETWCGRQGLDLTVCGQPAAGNDDMPAPVLADRNEWCLARDLTPDACASYFAGLERSFGAAWKEERSSSKDNLLKLDLRGRDLRRAEAFEASLVGANLVGAQLEGANLVGAQMEGADLGGAQMEGAGLGGARMERANLGGAQMEGANLHVAQMEGANLSGARMEGADLTGAQMEGASLTGAQMEWADLSAAQMEGADLSTAQMEGANLSGAQMEGADLRRAQMKGADLSAARMEGADLRYVDLRHATWADVLSRGSPAQFADLRGAQGLTQADLETLIGNSGTLLPDALSDAGSPYFVWSCRDLPPPGIAQILATAAAQLADEGDRWALRDEFLCGREPPHKTGTPLALEARRPPGHPLGEAD